MHQKKKVKTGWTWSAGLRITIHYIITWLLKSWTKLKQLKKMVVWQWHHATNHSNRHTLGCYVARSPVSIWKPLKSFTTLFIQSPSLIFPIKWWTGELTYWSTLKYFSLPKLVRYVSHTFFADKYMTVKLKALTSFLLIHLLKINPTPTRFFIYLHI